MAHDTSDRASVERGLLPGKRDLVLPGQQRQSKGEMAQSRGAFWPGADVDEAVKRVSSDPSVMANRLFLLLPSCYRRLTTEQLTSARLGLVV